jgi:hypothetical protein|tara:strand:+ start:1002 stop:1268 length:267 start_codon:yes stop_codon:yes gene_type:complete
LFLEQLQFNFVPILHGLLGRFAAQGQLRKLLVVEQEVAIQHSIQLLTGAEMLALEYIFDATVVPSTMPLVCGDLGGVSRCLIPRSTQS